MSKAALCALLVLAPAPAAAAPPAPCENCGVVLISVDTLRPDRLGAYGYTRPVSPNIDKLAAGGVRFGTYLSQGYLTPVCMASAFTSLYPQRSGYVNFVSSPAASVRTLPELLASAGYRTAAFVSAPELYRTRLDGGGEMSPFFARGFGEFRQSPVYRKFQAAEAASWLAANGKGRFFLWLALGDVHWPYGRRAGRGAIGRFAGGRYRGLLPGTDWADSLGRIWRDRFYPLPAWYGKRRPSDLTKADRDFISGSYDAGVWGADRDIGEVLSALKALGLEDRTLVVLHSIHGETLGEYGYYSHYDLYEGELRGALVLSGPGLRAGTAVGGAVSGLDLVPTILELAGLPPLKGAQGFSLARSALYGDAPPERPFFSVRVPYWERVVYGVCRELPRSFCPGTEELGARLAGSGALEADPAPPDAALRRGRFKLIHRNSRLVLPRISWWGWVSGREEPPSPEYELYDLSADPLERRNLAADGKPPPAGLVRELAAFEADFRARAPRRRDIRALQPYP